MKTILTLLRRFAATRAIPPPPAEPKPALTTFAEGWRTTPLGYDNFR